MCCREGSQRCTVQCGEVAAAVQPPEVAGTSKGVAFQGDVARQPRISDGAGEVCRVERGEAGAIAGCSTDRKGVVEGKGGELGGALDLEINEDGGDGVGGHGVEFGTGGENGSEDRGAAGCLSA